MIAGESQRMARVASLVILGLSVVLAIPFWFAIFRHWPTLPAADAPVAAAFLAGFFVVQLAGLLFLARLVQRAWRRSFIGLAVLGLIGSIAYLFASLASYVFTPAVGGPLMLLVLLFTAGSAAVYRYRAAIRSGHSAHVSPLDQ